MFAAQILWPDARLLHVKREASLQVRTRERQRFCRINQVRIQGKHNFHRTFVRSTIAGEGWSLTQKRIIFS
jgi:hypothetical protein